ncbi:MAG: divalent-cation tolerance protein CutA [Planctomycetota bacterium]
MTESADAPRLVLTTAPDLDTARRLAQELVAERLAACASLVPGVESVYRWNGAVESAREILLVVKTTSGRIGDLERWLARAHPYEVPELVVLDPAHVGAAYASWLAAETR